MSGSSLDGRVCLVTGGAQGIGWAVADRLARAGAKVHVCDIAKDHLTAAVLHCENLPHGRLIVLAHCDVSDSADLERWIGAVQDAEGRIDVLVNNAAFVRWESVEAMPVEAAEQTMLTGYHAMVRAVKLVLPSMRANGGHIVNLGSSAGRVITEGASAPYAASKAAIEAYTETLRLELAGSPVHVTLVRPGVVAGTSFFREHVPSNRLPRVADFVPFVTPPQIAAAIIKALHRPRGAIDIPGSLRLIYLLYALSPGAVRWLVRRGGHAHRDFGAVSWPNEIGANHEPG